MDFSSFLPPFFLAKKYLLYCGCDQIDPKDQYAISAAKTLHAKGIVHWTVDEKTVDFSPMFDKISQFLGEMPVHIEQKGFTIKQINDFANVFKG